MKNRYYIILFSTILGFIMIVTFFILYSINHTLTNVKQNTEIILPSRVPEHHFAMIAENVDSPIWKSIKRGIEQASREFNVAVEFNGPNSLSMDDRSKYLDVAIASKVDGIITYVWDEKQTGDLIQRAVSKDIPVITIGTDAKDSNRAAFVGVNTYNAGVQLGRMLLEATEGKGNAAILLSNDVMGGVMIQNLMISGMKEALKDATDIHLSIIEYNNSDYLGIEDAISGLLGGRQALDTIICTSVRDTIIVAQKLIDLNKVGYHIIGYGDSPEILRYIDTGVVFGVVTADYEQMGYDTIRALMDIKEKGRTSAYFTVDTRLITKKNVMEYVKAGED